MGKKDSVPHDIDAATSGQGHYLKLGLLCLAVALTVVVVTVLITPTEELEPDVSKQSPEPPAQAASPAASVTLATTPAEGSNEQLQTELVEQVEALQAAFPQSPHALHVAAGAYSKIHQTVKAGEIWKECIELDPRHVGPRLGLATLMSEKGEDLQAIEMLEDALADGCTSPELYYRLAEAHSKVGEVERAEAVMKTGVKVFPGFAINWLLLGQTQNQLQKFEDAEQSLLKSMALGNRDSEVYFALANACQRQGKAEQAAEYRKQFSELKAAVAKARKDKPFQEIYQQALRPIVVASLAAAAAIYNQQGDSKKGEQHFLRANALDPDNQQVLEELTSMYRKENRIADALVVQRRLVALEPANVIYHVNLAGLASQTGDWDAAEAALEEAKILKPDFALPYIGLAQLQLQKGELTQARQNAESSVRCEPSVQGLTLLAIICQQQGDMVAANEARQAAVNLKARGPQSLQQAQ